jgi:hypothetical protein
MSKQPPHPPVHTGPPVQLDYLGLVRVSPYIQRTRTYAFVMDENGQPIELGSGRFAKAYLGEERWVESKTTYRRNVAIKMMQRGVSPEDAMRPPANPTTNTSFRRKCATASKTIS